MSWSVNFNPYVSFCTKVSRTNILTLNADDPVARYRNGDINIPITLTQMRSTRFIEQYADYTFADTGAKIDFVSHMLSHLIFPAWRPIIEPRMALIKDELNTLLNSDSNFTPLPNLVLNAFNVVAPQDLDFILIGNVPRGGQNSAYAMGLGVVSHPPPHPAGAVTNGNDMAEVVQKRKTAAKRDSWEHMLTGIIKECLPTAIQKFEAVGADNLEFLLTGRILHLNMSLTKSTKHYQDDNMASYKHKYIWNPFIVGIISDILGMPRDVQRRPIRIITMGEVPFTALLAGGIHPAHITFMVHPQELGHNFKMVNRGDAIRERIKMALIESGLIDHLAACWT